MEDVITAIDINQAGLDAFVAANATNAAKILTIQTDIVIRLNPKDVY